jgi:hypothetical protein
MQLPLTRKRRKRIMQELGGFLVRLGPVFAVMFYTMVIAVGVLALSAGIYGLVRTRRQARAERRAAKVHRPAYTHPAPAHA